MSGRKHTREYNLHDDLLNEQLRGANLEVHPGARFHERKLGPLDSILERWKHAPAVHGLLCWGDDVRLTYVLHPGDARAKAANASVCNTLYN